MRTRLRPDQRRLPEAQRPRPVSIELDAVAIEQVEDAERELARHARADGNKCWGYFPSLTRHPGIHTDLPACRELAGVLPEIRWSGRTYQFNFLRLSLVGQSRQAMYHLDSDAATALTGDPATLTRREVGRILLNLSTTQERRLYYLDLDVSAVALRREGSYVRAADQAQVAQHVACAAVPPRSGQTVHGIGFMASRVLHSGVDGPHGHFVAAYGYDRQARAPWTRTS
jgi:hypothetical protein